MAGILDFIDQKLGTRLGLLMSDPRAAIEQMNQQAGAYNQASLLATQAERNALRGLPVTPEQAQAKQYVDKSLEDVAMGFAGTTALPKVKINKNLVGTAESDRCMLRVFCTACKCEPNRSIKRVDGVGDASAGT